MSTQFQKLELLRSCHVRTDTTLLPVGAIWLTELEVLDAQLPSKKSSSSRSNKIVKNEKRIKWEFYVVPTTPKHGTVPCLIVTAILAESGRLFFANCILPNGALPALVIGVLTAHSLRTYKQEFIIFICLIFLRMLGISILVFPTTAICSFFIFARLLPKKKSCLQIP
mmetsp:Transcript_12033/g.15096  ORF Transcript_12033/g.15096 Transcript_12033/m.15096 type:complete len:168 (-) Transcript_12033:355-858(-)